MRITKGGLGLNKINLKHHTLFHIWREWVYSYKEMNTNMTLC